MLRKVIIIFLFTTLYLASETEEKFLTGLKPDPPELLATVKEANPNNKQHRGLPDEVDLSPFMPPAGVQGKQASCVAFCTAYAHKSYIESIEKKSSEDAKLKLGDEPNYRAIFSPAFVYNQLNGGRDAGISITEAMSLIVSKGVVSWSDMPYDPNNFTKLPSQEQLDAAQKFRAKEFLKLRYNDPNEIKAQLAIGRPVVAGILVDDNFKNLKGKVVVDKSNQPLQSGHAVTIVGYDDSERTFKFLNSWGNSWGEKGYGYISYKWFSKVCRGAFVLIDGDENRAKMEMAATGSKPKTDPNKSGLFPPNEVNASKGNYPDRIVITWSNVKGAIGYEIYRGYPDEDSYQLVGLSHTTSFEDTGVTQGIAYSYRITTVTETDVSDKSEGAVVGYSLPIKNELPSKPSGLVASDASYRDKIVIEWQKVPNATSYQIFKWDNRSKSYRSLAKINDTRYEDKTATKNGVLEVYTVAALKGNTTGIVSDSVTGRTAPSSKLPPPENLTASAGQFIDKVELKWSKVEGAVGYLVYRFDDSNWNPLGFVTEESYIDVAATKGKKFYTVIAKSKDNVWGSYSEYVLGFIDVNSKRSGNRLEAPRNLQAILNKEADEVLLTWSAVPNTEDYTVWIKKPGEKRWNFLSKVESIKTSFITKLPEKNSFFLYSVTSRSQLGVDSEYSHYASVVSSTPKKASATRAFGGISKAEKIAGLWSAVQWEGGSNIKNVVMEIEHKGQNDLVIKIDNKKSYQVKYPIESTEVEIEGKLKIRISGSDALLVELKDKSVFRDRTELSFLRE
ncbi:MAG: C1 family peptidase [Leptospiraceae bacterium]|nr:C1 family peptidase [Leptospiraceae bacterium]